MREFADGSVEPHVVGFLHIPETPNGRGLVLSHGAGGNAQAPLLVALAETFSQQGFTVLRCTLPYRQVRSFGPPGPGDAARDRAGLKNAVACVKEVMGAPLLADVARKPAPSLSKSGGFDFPDTATKSLQKEDSGGRRRIYLAGHSYGGRQSSMLCAEEPDLVAGLLLLSYPLHPPRRPEQQRTQHLPDLHTPTLFVHGTRDPFASIEELQRAIKMIPAKAKLLEVEGAGHDLGFKGKERSEELIGPILNEFTKMFP